MFPNFLPMEISNQAIIAHLILSPNNSKTTNGNFHGSLYLLGPIVPDLIIQAQKETEK
jgi:hypothetical protein